MPLTKVQSRGTENVGAGSKSLVINGGMSIAQRGSSSTGTGYKTVDRFQMGTSGVDNDPTQAQVDVASGTTPYTLGLRKAYKITNANQSSGAGSSDIIDIKYIFEAQDVATSGWNYNSSSSYVTLSFWVKSSVAQNFFGHVKTFDGTAYNYPFSTGSLTADTWTKVTKTISGNSNLTINNDNGQGLEIRWALFYGTDRTASVTEDAWATYDNAQRTPDNTSTWYTTNSATFEITGVQLEVGSQASDFQHEDIGTTLAKCQRYFEKSNEMVTSPQGSNSSGPYISISSDNSGNACWSIEYKVRKRADPTQTWYADNGTEGEWGYYKANTSLTYNTVNSHRENEHATNAYMAVGGNNISVTVFGNWKADAEL
tara:strand:- start:330 stop:1439 length:1110 start_codon:yes stop_codon:yes gene_type:complete